MTAEHGLNREFRVQVWSGAPTAPDPDGVLAAARAPRIIKHCAHPDFRERLDDYFERAQPADPHALHTPHLLDEAFAWHLSYLENGRM